MTSPQPRPRARRCRGCGLLLFASQSCEPCDTATVHVITELGPTDGPGRLASAKLLPRRTAAQDLFDEAMRRDFDTSVFTQQPDPCPYPNCISRRGHRGRHPIVRPSQDTTETL